jgi:hypothetical protein
MEHQESAMQSGLSRASLAGNSTVSDDELYWRQNFKRQPFYIDGLKYEDYAPAFRMGHTRQREDTLFEDVERRYGTDWEAFKGSSRLSWFEARHAVRAGWERSAELVTH